MPVFKPLPKVFRMILIVCSAFFLLLMATACVGYLSKRPPPAPQEMSAARAVELTQAWCRNVYVPFDPQSIQPDGSFRGIYGAAEIFYDATQKHLSIEGLLIKQAILYAKRPYFLDFLTRVSQREPYTTGEGYMALDLKPAQKWGPLVVLRKDFSDGSITPKQFVLETEWLMNWSTYWRLQRINTASGKSEEELIAQAPGIEAWARKSSLRPW